MRAEAFPEERFLRALLRAWDAATSGPGAAEHAAAVRPTEALGEPPACDWKVFLELVRAHGVAHAARAGLAAAGERHAPPEVARGLDRLKMEVRSFNVLLLDRLQRLAACLERAKVELLVLKGPALLSILYRDLAERPMVDLDILIRRVDLARALEAMEEAGFELPKGGERRFWEQSYHHIAARLGSNLPVSVEVHWDLELRERYPFSLERIWAESERFSSAGCELRTLSRLDHFVFGAIHLARHFYQPRLIWLVDQRRMMREWGLDWAAVAERARACRALTPLWFMAACEERVFGQSLLPDRVRPPLRPLQRWLFGRLSGPRPLEPLRDVMHESRRIFATLLLFDRLRDLARFLLVRGRRKAIKWSGLERILRQRV